MASSSQLPRLLHVLIGAQRGGCERDSYILARHLDSFAHDIIVVGERGAMSKDWEVVSASVQHLDLMKLSRRRRLLRMNEVFSNLNVDAVILWHGMAELPPLLHTLPTDCRPILIHGGNPATGFRGWSDFRYFMMERKWPHCHDPVYVCCSRYVADSFDRSRYLRRFRRCVIYNGVEHESEILHRPRKLSADSPVTIGMMARLDRIKDHPTLIRAMGEVIQIIPRARLELAGDGREMTHLQRLVRNLGLERSVAFLGSVTKVYETISRWDVFAYAATPREGFGNSVAEAMMCGLPCVVTNLPPLREVCGSDQSVCYVAPTDSRSMAAAIVKLINDFDARLRLTAAAREWALRELSAEVYAARYAELLASEHNRLARADTVSR